MISDQLNEAFKVQVSQKSTDSLLKILFIMLPALLKYSGCWFGESRLRKTLGVQCWKALYRLVLKLWTNKLELVNLTSTCMKPVVCCGGSIHTRSLLPLYGISSMSNAMASGTASTTATSQIRVTSTAFHRGIPMPFTLLHDVTAW